MRGSSASEREPLARILEGNWELAKNSKMAGDACFTFLLVSKVCSVYLYVRANYSSNGKYSIVSILFLLDTKYVGMLSVALCLDRGLSLIMSPGI